MLEEYYKGGFFDVDSEPMCVDTTEDPPAQVSDPSKNQLLEERIEPREKLPPLFVNLSDRSLNHSSVCLVHSCVGDLKNWIILGHRLV